MKQAAEVCAASNPDIIDINWLSVKNVACKGAGAGILQDIPKMVKMTLRSSRLLISLLP